MNDTLNNIAIATGASAPPLLSPASLRAVPDKDCTVYLIQGAGLDSRRLCFELALLSLNPEKATESTLALETPAPNFSLGIQGRAETDGPVMPHSLALTAGLVAEGYIPEGWLCGLLAPAVSNCEHDYLTIFDSQGIYGRSKFARINLIDERTEENPQSRLSQERLQALLQKEMERALPVSVDPQRAIEALYVDHERIELAETGRGLALTELSESLEILVERLPAPSSDLQTAGLRWLATEVK